ncbi:c-type cytochrome [Fulvivirga sp. M361]|uniref:c-type cytochrome n=1 Tax=Fulvivirga sp. M361 TaxID=2594266 RepID=UPI00117B9E89|nr:c-type cytochrome [Fulvivirga sp. M361]TRX51177.1 c-type cytochrome [Fulvivirga sp. M361]
MKRLYRIIFFSLTFGVSINCAFSQIMTGDTVDTKAVLVSLRMNCYACHNPKVTSHDYIMAPPLVAVKYRYKLKYPDKEAFTANMTDFMLKPSREKAIMPGPVERFGVMPQIPIDAEQLKKIAAYIYDHEIEEPSWFPAHFEEKHGAKWGGQ